MGRNKIPVLPAEGFIAPSATLVGDVTVGEKASVWYGCVLRGDVQAIKIGSKTNLQDGTVVHVARFNTAGKATPTLIGDRVTVGHAAILHACTIKDDAFIGMGATIMDSAVVEQGAMVAAGAVVPPGFIVPTGEVWAGVPAKFLRSLTLQEQEFISMSADNYAELSASHAEEASKSFAEVQRDVALREDALKRSDDYDSHIGMERPIPITALEPKI